MSLPQLDLSNAVALFDLDSAVYRAGFACESKQMHVYKDGTLVSVVKTMTEANEVAKFYDFENIDIKHEHIVEPVQNAVANLKAIMDRAMEQFKCKWELYLTGSGNFRYDMATIQPYKGNRELMLKPAHYPNLRTYAVKFRKARIIHGMEADDEISIRHTELLAEGKTPIVVSIDKDMKQLVGWNYNFVKNVLEYIDEHGANLSFYTQVLMGDRTDNIPGLEGVGIKTAEKLLAKSRTPYEMYQVVLREYRARNLEHQIKEIATLLWLQRTRTLTEWEPPLPSASSP